MRFIRTLGPGDKFRVAHPKQFSVNSRPMPRDQVFKVQKVYEMSPYYTLAIQESGSSGIYSLMPGTPVLFVKEPDPTEEEILEFLDLRQGTKKKVVEIGRAHV